MSHLRTSSICLRIRRRRKLYLNLKNQEAVSHRTFSMLLKENQKNQLKATLLLPTQTNRTFFRRKKYKILSLKHLTWENIP